MPEVDEREKALAFLRAPEDWPHWPRLPLKRRDKTGQLESAVVFAQDADHLPIKVFKANLYQAINWKLTDCYEYASYEEMVDEGKWEID